MKKILIFDDDDKVCTVFKRFLEGHGYNANYVLNGEEGMMELEKELPDLVITDIMMPKKDGLEVVLEMRKNYPNIPVIAISGGMQTVSMDMLPMVKKLGAHYVFYKPVELNDLLKAIRAIFENEES